MGLTIRTLAAATASVLLLWSAAHSQAPSDPPAGPARLFADNCAGCHGADRAGGRGPALTEARLVARVDAQLRHTIAAGVPGTEMPAFGGTLSNTQIAALAAYLRTPAPATPPRHPFVPSPDGQVLHTQKQDVRVEVVARLETPWGMVFLPDGRMLVTERPGRLRIVARNGALLPAPVSGLPPIHAGQDGGLLDVAIHPDYRRNGWIYLSYSEADPGSSADPVPRTMTVAIRGRLDANNRWTDTQTIFRAPSARYTTSGSHYGSRFLFDRHGHLFFSVGERGDMRNAQDLASPLGKIHRVNADGSVPADNPFVHTPDAVPTIWSYGHRNPEGLAWDPVTGLLWESEHGPFGGDEINIIEKGRNYGWGVISMGKQPGITGTSAPGMEQPVVFYTPTIAPSGITFYSGSKYPGWKNSLFVSGLAGQQLRRLEIHGRQVTAQEILFDKFGRTRAVVTGPDGLLYILLQNPTGLGTGVGLSESTPGMIIRLVPIK
ncbi:PQQ-dependent sugar dehydrogenase [Sphingomonas crusticola]|uniref:PQQ-dependent sugar dehydrogenase n=1 Tax=Sphingomonas crusticola TaxID=1697973 RepID=UPI000E278685|nr:PQQ-dependent sugar dehydrogenase [Sphingomonas crusticola]